VRVDPRNEHRVAVAATGSRAAFLLVSMGGAIVAAPLTVPLLFLVSQRHPTTAFRVTGTVLTAATVPEVAWALTYRVADEAKPWIWLAPLGAGFARPRRT
jgi:hypothetical protein